MKITEFFSGGGGESLSLNYSTGKFQFQNTNCHQFIQKLLHNYIPEVAFYESYATFFGYAKQLA